MKGEPKEHTMEAVERLTSLRERLARCREDLAVQTAQENEKKKRREELAKELKAAGIDINKPEQELERLRSEVDRELQAMEASVSKFEAELKGEVPLSPVPSATMEVLPINLQNERAPAMVVDELDLD